MLMEAVLGGLGLNALWLGLRVLLEAVLLLRRLAAGYLPGRRLAFFIFIALAVALSFAIAELSRNNVWLAGAGFAAFTGISGWIGSIRQAQAMPRPRHTDSRRAKSLYRQYQANPQRLNTERFRADFERYWDWPSVKADVISSWRRGRMRCNGCTTLIRGKRIHVDHVKPRSKYPHLRYLKSNLQVLCDRCNLHKNDYDGDDWREVIAERKKAHARRQRGRQQRRRSA